MIGVLAGSARDLAAADEPLGREHWAHHNSAANFAVANRHVVVEGIRADPSRERDRTSLTDR
jgi:hypothetical protein